MCYLIVTGLNKPNKLKGDLKMRAIKYAVMNKENKTIVFKSFHLWECENYLSTMENGNGYAIGYKWIVA